MIAGSLEIELMANIARLQADMNQAKQVVGDAMSQVSSAVESAKKALAGLGAITSIAGFAALIEKTIQATAELHTLAQRTGVTVEALSGLRGVAKISGTSMDEIAVSMQKLSKNMVEAQSGTGTAAKTFAALGVSVTDSSGKLKSIDQVMLETAKSMMGFESGAALNTAAMNIFGKSGANLIPMLSVLAEKGEISAKATSAQAKEAYEFIKAQKQLEIAVSGAFKALAMNLLPVVLKLSELFKPAAFAAVGFWAAFVGVPALFALIGTAVTATTAYAARMILVMALNAGTAGLASIAWAGLNTTLIAIGPTFSGLIAKYGLLQTTMMAGLGILVAAYAGWKIGEWLNNNFVEARLAGIAFVEGMLICWEAIKYGAGIAWAAIAAMWDAAIAGMGEGLSGFLEMVSGGLGAMGMGAAAQSVMQWATSAKEATKSTTTLAERTAVLGNEYEASKTSIRAITGDMAEQAIASFKTADAIKAQKKELNGLGESGKEVKAATDPQIKAYSDLIAAIEAKTEANKLEAAGSEKLTQAQQEQINIEKLVKEGKISLAQATSENTKAALTDLAAAEKEKEQNKLMAHALEDVRQARIKSAQTQEAAAASAADANKNLREEIELMGLSQREQTNILKSRNNITIATKEATLAEMQRQSAITGTMTREEIALGSEIEQLKERNNLLGVKIDRSEAVKAAEDATAAFKQSAENISNSLTDALMRGFEGGKGMAANFADILKNMFKTLVLQPIIKAVINPISGVITGMIGTTGNAATGTQGSGILGSIATSAIGSYVGGITTAITAGFHGASLGAGLMGPTTAGATGAMGFGNMLAAVPGWGWAAAAAIAVIASGFGKTVGEQHAGGYYSSTGKEANITNAKAVTAGGGWDDGAWARDLIDRANPAVKTLVGTTVDAVLSVTNAKAKALGVNIALGIDAGMATNPNGEDKSTYGYFQIYKDGQAIGENYANRNLGPDTTAAAAQYAADMQEAAAAAVLAGTGFREVGETAVAALDRLGSSLQGVNAVFTATGSKLMDVSLSGADAASQLVAKFGGVEKFTQSVGAYYDTFFTKQEKTAQSVNLATNAIDGLGFAVPLTNGAFQTLVEGLDRTTTSGRETYAALVQIAPAVTQLKAASLAAIGVGSDTLTGIVQGFLEGKTTAVDAGTQFGDAVSNGLKSAISAAGAAAIVDIFVGQIITPIVQSVMAGSTLQDALASTNIDGAVAQARTTMAVYAEVLNDPAIKGLGTMLTQSFGVMSSGSTDAAGIIKDSGLVIRGSTDLVTPTVNTLAASNTALANASNNASASINSTAAALNAIPKDIKINVDVSVTGAGGIKAQGSFAVGSPYIPQDMLANIHKGEMVIDSASANVLRKYGINASESVASNGGDNMATGLLASIDKGIAEIAPKIMELITVTEKPDNAYTAIDTEATGKFGRNIENYTYLSNDYSERLATANKLYKDITDALIKQDWGALKDMTGHGADYWTGTGDYAGNYDAANYGSDIFAQFLGGGDQYTDTLNNFIKERDQWVHEQKKLLATKEIEGLVEETKAATAKSKELGTTRSKTAQLAYDFSKKQEVFDTGYGAHLKEKIGGIDARLADINSLLTDSEKAIAGGPSSGPNSGVAGAIAARIKQLEAEKSVFTAEQAQYNKALEDWHIAQKKLISKEIMGDIDQQTADIQKVTKLPLDTIKDGIAQTIRDLYDLKTDTATYAEDLTKVSALSRLQLNKARKELYDQLLSPEEINANKKIDLSKQFTDLGFVMPGNIAGLRAMIDAIKGTDFASQTARDALLQLIPGFVGLQGVVSAAAETIEQSYTRLRGVTKTTEQIAQEKIGLEDRLFAATASQAQIATHARDAIADYNKSLYDQVIAAEKARSAVDANMAVLQRAADSERKLINTRLQSAQTLKDQTQGIFDSLKSEVDKLYGSVQSTQSASFADGSSFVLQALNAAISTGLLPEKTELQHAIDGISNGISTKIYTNQFDVDRDRLVLAGQLDALKKISGTQLSASENMIKIEKDQLTVLDNQLDAAKNQIDALRGVDISVMSVADAIKSLQASISKEISTIATTVKVTTGPNPGGTTPISGNGGTASASDVSTTLSNLYQQVLGRTPDAAGIAYWTGVANSGVSGINLVNQFVSGAGSELAHTGYIPKFATGGLHAGGLRIVGENGPEIESTGPSRIWNSTDTMRMLGRSSSDDSSSSAISELLSEVRGLREDNAAQARAMVQLQLRATKLMERWEGYGMPETRAQA